MDKTVTIYSTPTCHFCQMSKDFFKDKGIAYTEYNVAGDMEKRQEMIQKSGKMGVPVILVGDEVIVGFDQEKLVSSLGVAASKTCTSGGEPAPAPVTMMSSAPAAGAKITANAQPANLADILMPYYAGGRECPGQAIIHE